MPNLWWAYDEDDASFSTLPTGPFLVPALFIAGIAVLWQTCFYRHKTLETVAGHVSKTDEWQRKRKRYDELTDKLAATNNNLELSEHYELRQLQEYLYNPHGY